MTFQRRQKELLWSKGLSAAKGHVSYWKSEIRVRNNYVVRDTSLFNINYLSRSWPVICNPAWNSANWNLWNIMPLQNCNQIVLVENKFSHAAMMRRSRRGLGMQTPLENHKAVGFLRNTGMGRGATPPPGKSQATQPAFSDESSLAHQQTPFKWHFAGGALYWV